MALFPAAPANGQQATVNGIVYTYNSAQTAWVRTNSATLGDYLVTGNMSATGNITANYFVGNGAYLTGISVSSVANIANGNSSVSIPASNGNVNVTAVGNTTLVITGTGANVTGTFAASGNISGTRIISNIATGTAPFVVTSTTQVANLNAATAGTVITNAQPNITSVSSSSSSFTIGSIANGGVHWIPGSFTINRNIGTSEGGQLTLAWANTSNIQGEGSNTWNLDVNSSNSFRIFYKDETGTAGTVLSLNPTNNTASFSGNVSAPIFVGSGNNLSNIQGANVSGAVANATYATSAGTATSATSATTAATANSVAGANVTGTVANATYATSAGSSTTAGTVTTNAQPNITSVGTLTSLTVSGNVNIDIGTFFVDSSSNTVGIGTTTPIEKFEVNGGTRIFGRFDESTSNAGVYIGITDSTPANLLNDTPRVGFFNGNTTQNWQIDNNNGVFRWFTPGVVRMAIDANGNLGVGNSTPNAKIHVSGGSVLVDNNSGYRWTDTSGTQPVLACQSDNNIVFYSTGAAGASRPIWSILARSDTSALQFSTSIVSADLVDTVGYKGVPQNQQVSAYTIELSDIGKHIYATAGTFAINIPPNSTTAFPIGTAITIICEDASKTVVPGSGVTLVLAGTGAATTGTRTLAIGSMATIIKVQTDRWYISGAGVT